jgi:DNA-binding beta-propeller fold protein YncE
LFRLIVTDNDGSNSTDDVIILIKNNPLLQKAAGTVILEPIPSMLSAGDFYDFKGILNLSHIADGSYVQIRNGEGTQCDELLTFAPVEKDGNFKAPWTAVPREETLTIYAMYTDNSGNTFRSKYFPMKVMGFESSPGVSNQDRDVMAGKTMNAGASVNPFMEIHFSDWNRDNLNVYIVAIDPSSQGFPVEEAKRAIRDLEKLMEGRTGNNEGWNFNISPTNGFPLPRQAEDGINFLFTLTSIDDGVACGYSHIVQRLRGEYVANEIFTSPSCGDVYWSTMHEFLHSLGLGHTWHEGNLADGTRDMMCSNEWFLRTGKPTCDNNIDTYVDASVPTEFNLRALLYTYGNNGFLEPNANIREDFNPHTDVKYYCNPIPLPCVPQKANIPPVSEAGKSISAKSGTTVSLDGSKSFDSDGSLVSYSWIQLSGPQVKLYLSATAKPNFYFPNGNMDKNLVFQLTVKDDKGSYGVDTVIVKPIVSDSDSKKQFDKNITTKSSNATNKIFATGYYFVSKIGFPGTGKGQILEPTDLSIDLTRNVLYVADKNNDRIQKLDTNGNYLTSQFLSPADLAVDFSANIIFVSDLGNNRIQKFDTNGNFLHMWGSFGRGFGQFDHVGDIALDTKERLVYVTDIGNHRVQKFDYDGKFISSWGSLGSGQGRFDRPAGLDYDSSGIVYVVDTNNNRIQKFDTEGNFLGMWGQYGKKPGQFDNPVSLNIDSTSGYFYVSDAGNKRIVIFDQKGKYVDGWGVDGGDDGEFERPVSVAFGNNGRVYVVDKDRGDIQIFANDGKNAISSTKTTKSISKSAPSTLQFSAKLSSSEEVPPRFGSLRDSIF